MYERHITSLVSLQSPIHIGLSCGPLGNPFNGQVTFSSTSVGSVARYSCNPGFRVNGESTRQCLEQGVWSGNEPICESKHSYLILGANCFDILSLYLFN